MNDRLVEGVTVKELFGVNIPKAHQLQAAHTLALMLRPIRAKWGRLGFTSGYRNKSHNAQVGGAANSDHLYGDWVTDPDDLGRVEAAIDFYLLDAVGDHARRLAMYDWIAAQMPHQFGQLIWYPETTHVHISIASLRHQGQKLVKTATGKYIAVSTMAEIKAMDKRVK